MDIEKEIFNGTKVDFSKLKDFGFIKNNDIYVYEKIFFNDNFNALITINSNGKVSGKVIDLQLQEEYTNIRIKMSGDFINKVRDEYKDILIDIRNHCCETNFFINDQTNRIVKYVKNKYGDDPLFLWNKYPRCGVLRNKNNKKWYAIIMNIDLSKLDNLVGECEIINVKLDKDKIKELLNEKGFYEAYHMNKKNWISITLNDSIRDEIIFLLIDQSYNLVK